MKLAGNIEDLGLGEILQIISFSQKSGTLKLKSRKREGSMVFKNGQITKANSTKVTEGVGDVLLKTGVIDDATLTGAKASQTAQDFKNNLGDVLINEFGVSPEKVEEAAKKLIEKTVYSFFFWHDGSFTFELTEFDESPETIREETLQYSLPTGLNPQFLAMEGSRLYDEFIKEGGVIDEPEEEEEEAPAEPAALTEAAPAAQSTTTKAPPAPEESGEAIPFLAEGFLKELEEEGLLEQPSPSAADPRIEESKGLTLLKEMLEELSRPLSMSEIVLLILRFSSEIMNRAVVFAIKKGNIVGMGQYGIELKNGNADKMVRKMKIPLDEPSILREAIEKKVKQIKPLEACKWNDYLVEKLGGQRPSHVFISPVVVHGKVAAIIYGDNIPTDNPIEDTSSLEIFLAQTSIALERLVLQKHIGTVA